MSGFVYTKEAQRKIDKLQEEIHNLECRKTKLERTINEISAGQCPIKPGDIIKWERGRTDSPRSYRGKVISVSTCGYRGFEFRCHILSKHGKQIGFANVAMNELPTLA